MKNHAERVAVRRRWWGSGAAVLLRALVGLVTVLVLTNVVGAAATFLVAAYVVPEPHSLTAAHRLDTYIAAAVAYLAVATVVGVVMGLRKLSSLADWLPSERPPTAEEQLTVLRGPRTLARGMGVLWFGGTVLFGALTFARSMDAGLRITAIVGLSGVITTAVAFRFAELLLREAAGRALSASEHPQRIAQSVAVRSLMTWVAGTGAPVLGVVLLGVASMIDHVGTRRDLALATAVLGANCLFAGFITTVFVTRATADPIISVRRALARNERGELDVSVPVYDGTDIGLLQAGFNRMAAGLREREELRDLFGRHVGVDVARRALEHGVELGGELRDVAVLYIDIVGSTTIAARMPAQEVVDLLNRVVGVVIDVVESAD
ncbi:MAG: adenylate/guanylate cyclase domain-containing protein, partial [Mycobacteriales bacterium]